MTEFVLEQDTKEHWSEDFTKCVIHAKFLQQTPTLGMFVPTDEEGNVLEELENINKSIDCYNAVAKYQQAKQRVIFEGWLIQYKDNLQIVISDQNMDNIYFNIDGTILYNNQLIKKIEDLVPCNLTLK